MHELWNIRAEITVQPEDFPSGDWHIVEVDEAKILNVDFVYEDEEFRDMVNRARCNPATSSAARFTHTKNKLAAVSSREEGAFTQ
jgi:hypothetical protein